MITGFLALTSNEKTIIEMTFSTEKATEANWLAARNLKTYVLTLPTEGEPIALDQKVIGAEKVTIEVRTDQTNSSGSLWLSYLK